MNLDFFKDLHKDRKAVIVAGGPSLARTNLEYFSSEFIFLGVSLTYRHVKFYKNRRSITYQFIGDRNIFDQIHYDFLYGHPFAQLFVSKGIYEVYKNKINLEDTSYFIGGGAKKFHTDLTKPIYGGGTSTFLALQFAYYMGFKKVYLVGLDHSWNFDSVKKVGEGAGGRLLETIGEDKNHFSKDFYPEGIKWFKPKEDKMLEAYKMAGEAYLNAGRILLNASIETKVPSKYIPRFIDKALIK